MSMTPGLKHRLQRERRTAVRYRPFVCERLEDRALLTVTPQLLMDLNSMPVGVHVFSSMASLNGSIYFAGAAGNTDYGLWRSDGTPAGTALVTHISSQVNGI